MSKSPLVRNLAVLFVLVCLLAGPAGALASPTGGFTDHVPDYTAVSQKIEIEDHSPQVVEPDPMVQLMIDQVSTDDIYDYLRGFAGEQPVWVDGAWYTITSRHSQSGTPFLKAAHYLGEQYAENGLDVEYHTWSAGHGPNVIAELPGLTNPDDIYIIGGHLDDVGASSDGAGADDNASGTVAGLIAADILSQYQWGCTLRFVGWSGEEEGLLGSAAYALRSDNLNENIVGYLNLDMIAWNDEGSSPEIYLAYNASMPDTLAMAQLFADVVDAYDIDLIPELGTSLSGGSDHSSFWNHGYTSILGIEGYDDFNPYYHGPNDTTANTDPVYFTNYVKAALATFVHFNNCLIPSGIGSLDGHVTATDGGAAIEGALVTIDDGAGHVYNEITGPTGYYTRTLLTGAYDLNVSAYGYLSETFIDAAIITDTVTTVDFALETAPIHTVSGYVREIGTNAPLAAAVELLDTPVAPVNTDPATGFFSLQVAEGAYQLKASSANHGSQTVEIVVTGDLTQNFFLYTFCDIFSDDVEDGNLGWTAQSPWAITTEASHSPTHSWTESPGSNYGNNRDVSLTSPVWDLSDSSGLSLSFWHQYDTEEDYDYATVEYSLDGGTNWTSAASYNGSNLTWHQQVIDIPELDGQANARVRFHFTSDGSLTYQGWHVDDIVVNAAGPACAPDLPPTADFSSSSPAYAGLPVAFTNLTVGSPVIEYEWDFGDGQGTSIDVNPTYTYTQPGSYTVVLTATNGLGSDTVEHDIEVLASPDIYADPTAITVTLMVGGNVTQTLEIGNLGAGDLEITAITPSGDPWLGLSDVPALPLTLAEDGFVVLSVDFDAIGQTPGTYTGTITIASNDPDTPDLQIEVTMIVTGLPDDYHIFLPVVRK